MATASVDLSVDMKQKVVKELERYKCVLDSQTPIGKGAFGYVYRARRVIGGDLRAIKVVLIPKMINEEKRMLLKSIDQEVIRFV